MSILRSLSCFQERFCKFQELFKYFLPNLIIQELFKDSVPIMSNSRTFQDPYEPWRRLVLAALSFNIQFSASYIEGPLNILADKISRLQVTTADLEQYGMNREPDVVPTQLQPNNWKF